MTEQELNERGIYIETYGDGFIIADYSEETPSRFGARYRGERGGWRDQPMTSWPFETKEEAIEAA